MSKIQIIIPTFDYVEVETYYRDAMKFSNVDGLFHLPVENSDTALKLMIVAEEAKLDFPPRKYFPIFRYEIEKNFLSYCRDIYRNGALIEMACATPGGYYARISDPAGNQFEVECNSFDEVEPHIDTSSWSFFYSY